MNENKQDKMRKPPQQGQQNQPRRPEDLESQGEQKGPQQIPTSQTDVTRKQ